MGTEVGVRLEPGGWVGDGPHHRVQRWPHIERTRGKSGVWFFFCDMTQAHPAHVIHTGSQNDTLSPTWTSINSNTGAPPCPPPRSPPHRGCTAPPPPPTRTPRLHGPCFFFLFFGLRYPFPTKFAAFPAMRRLVWQPEPALANLLHCVVSLNTTLS